MPTISDPTRLLAALPTLRLLTEAQARITLVSHLELASLLAGEAKVSFANASSCVSAEAATARDRLGPGEIVVLENTRLHPGETVNEPAFAAALAHGADLYVGDAFGAAHRAHGSTVGAAAAARHAVAGLCMEDELAALLPLVDKPPKPFTAILGGAKVSSKLPLIRALLPRVDTLIVGGGMAYTLLAAQGVPVGNSLVERELLADAASLVDDAAAAGVSLVLPCDAAIAESISAATVGDVVDLAPGAGIPDGAMGLDIGPASLDLFAAALKGSQAVLWNGPMGLFESPPFATGTAGLARLLADLRSDDPSVVTVVGGGDSVAAVAEQNLTSAFSHVSTGGGATLELLQGIELPGVAVLSK
ncbi:phosphoglycerate kinase [Thecamonas trahens ATCC 50062]|uniref:Phosphoglycerate kinase n=1 Tax=Thecamonas trahens ATCC 50062 TaxID=461836 RepID=A0A0L0DW25_THETB|nr:phosphoglycerate kinase [Thecamonas trahens ATCC 50062]KNC55718.1 phosphoglycerate kinase [Thecamonas trahens ATCC 50062]|eukprot:XP_013752926.1 phosphoglycerate kinase [Thecamonas trahens ATCC 50062]